MTNQQCIIEVEGLWTRFGENVIHRDIDLCVRCGEVFALVGGSGSGKTVLLRQMLGLEKPARGTIRVFGQSWQTADPGTVRQMRSRCGVLFQEGALFSALSVYDNVALPLRELGTLDETTIHDLVMVKLDSVGIAAGHARKFPEELSGGMIKRVALARAIALDPELLFLDEPTAGLDPDRSESLVKLIKSLRAELHLTVVMATHDLHTIAELSDRVAMLADQHLVAVAPLEELIKQDHPFIRSFFLGERGRSALNAAESLRAEV
jgi:phospholipid/cholesterol/gamma-HCH transport system ATP-binding protein